MSLARELGLSEAEYAEALLLQRLYQLIQQQLRDRCPQCRNAPITHYDLQKLELLCAQCAGKTAKKIGEHKLRPEFVQRLETKYQQSTEPAPKPQRAAEDEDFNVWWDLPPPRARTHVSAAVEDEEEDANTNFTNDLPGMAGIMKQMQNTRSVTPIANCFSSQQSAAGLVADKSQKDIAAVLQEIVENQKYLNDVINRISDHLCEATTPRARSASANTEAHSRDCMEPLRLSAPQPLPADRTDARLAHDTAFGGGQVRWQPAQRSGGRPRRNPFRDNPFT